MTKDNISKLFCILIFSVLLFATLHDGNYLGSLLLTVLSVILVAYAYFTKADKKPEGNSVTQAIDEMLAVENCSLAVSAQLLFLREKSKNLNESELGYWYKQLSYAVCDNYSELGATVYGEFVNILGDYTYAWEQKYGDDE